MIWASSLLSLHVFLGIIPMLGFSAGGLLPGTVLAARWFPHRQGLATGFVVGALPGGQALFAGLASIVLLVIPWREAYVLLTLGFSLSLLLLILLIVRDAPEGTGRSASAARAAAPSLVGTVNFWLLAAGYAVCGITDQIMVVHLVPFLTDEGYSVAGGSVIFAVLSLAGLIGSILVGPIVDFFQARYVIAVVYLLRALSYPFLFLSASTGSVSLIFIFAAVFGVTYMGNMPPTAVFLKHTYGPNTIAPTTGWLSMIHHLGGTGGVFVAGVLYEFTDGYSITFVASFITLLLAAAATLFLSSNRAAPEAAERAG
jgi:predicted MFS family arabinose efflux permease